MSYACSGGAPRRGRVSKQPASKVSDGRLSGTARRRLPSGAGVAPEAQRALTDPSRCELETSILLGDTHAARRVSGYRAESGCSRLDLFRDAERKGGWLVIAGQSGLQFEAAVNLFVLERAIVIWVLNRAQCPYAIDLYGNRGA